MPDNRLNSIALHIVEAWLLLTGGYPIVEWEISDSNFHFVYSASAKIQPVLLNKLDINTLSKSMINYLAEINKMSDTVKFNLFKLKLYECSYNGEICLKASIYI